MKKILGIVLIGMLILSGCSSNNEPQETEVYHFGSASITTMSVADADADLAKDGKVEVTTTYATVVLDSDENFVHVYLDSAQNAGTFDSEGMIVTSDVVPTKKEKGADYGMVGNSGIGKEWFEQIEALETYLVGKNKSALTELKLDSGYISDEEDLKSSVTINVTGLIDVLKKAVDNAVEVEGIVAAGTASVTSLSATDALDAEGKVEASVTYASVGFDADGKVVYVFIDTAQNKGTFSEEGAVVASEVVPTKKEKGTDYGMVGNSGIGKEWDEQVEALEEWMTGKTIVEISELGLTDGKVSESEDLSSSVTISVGAYLAVVPKAADNQVSFGE